MNIYLIKYLTTIVVIFEQAYILQRTVTKLVQHGMSLENFFLSGIVPCLFLTILSLLSSSIAFGMQVTPFFDLSTSKHHLEGLSLIKCVRILLEHNMVQFTLTIDSILEKKSNWNIQNAIRNTQS